MISDRWGVIILITVGSIWWLSNILAMVAAITDAFEYSPQIETHGIFSLVLATVFAIKRKEHGVDDSDSAPKGGEHRR